MKNLYLQGFLSIGCVLGGRVCRQFDFAHCDALQCRYILRGAMA
jgi:hypothetical protein